MTDYHYKYIKYKTKYINLQNELQTSISPALPAGGQYNNFLDNDDYLDGIVFVDKADIDITSDMKKRLMVAQHNLLGEIGWLGIEKTINNAINKLSIVAARGCNTRKNTVPYGIDEDKYQDPYNSNKWIECSGSCRQVVSQMVDIEVSTTAYILRTLGQSVLTANQRDGINLMVRVRGDIRDITGEWTNDKKMLDIVQYGDEAVCIRSNNCHRNGRLIMGFGPSASGKTHWAGIIIELLNDANNEFPLSFITIDGGIYRETSRVYQIAKKSIRYKCFPGFSNLVLASFSIFKKSLFDSSIIKKIIIDYVKDQASMIKINLYVPETLGGCGFIGKKCYDAYEPYIKITHDTTWIGLLIWQHRTGQECTFDYKYRCKGCTESGKMRERKEGKKYSNASWARSMTNGMRAMFDAPGGSYMIHNTGGARYASMRDNKLMDAYCINIIDDYSDYPTPTPIPTPIIKDELRRHEINYNYKYIYSINPTPIDEAIIDESNYSYYSQMIKYLNRRKLESTT